MLRVTEQNAIVRQFEAKVLQGSYSDKPTTHSFKVVAPQQLLASRMFFSDTGAYPITTMSFIKYDAGIEAKKLSKQKADDQKGLEVFDLPKRDWRGLTYKPLLEPLQEDGYLHDPNILDNPEMLYGAHKHSLKPSAQTGPIFSSIILYVNDKDLKDELNVKFREQHPHLPPSLTLSKIRNIKKTALLGCMKLDLEVSTVAYAVVYFERLCLKGLVTKFNRHLTMGVSLLMAYKFNENVGEEYHKRLEDLLAFVDHRWEISRKEIFAAEFGAFVQLGFSLHVPHQQVKRQ